jgi:hypothetical protein
MGKILPENHYIWIFNDSVATQVTYGHQIELPAVVGFLDQNYLYKLVASQIPYDSGYYGSHTLAENSSLNRDP